MRLLMLLRQLLNLVKRIRVSAILALFRRQEVLVQLLMVNRLQYVRLQVCR